MTTQTHVLPAETPGFWLSLWVVQVSRCAVKMRSEPWRTKHSQMTLFRAEAGTLKCLLRSSGRRDGQQAKAATVVREAGNQESMWEHMHPSAGAPQSLKTRSPFSPKEEPGPSQPLTTLGTQQTPSSTLPTGLLSPILPTRSRDQDLRLRYSRVAITAQVSSEGFQTHVCTQGRSGAILREKNQFSWRL